MLGEGQTMTIRSSVAKVTNPRKRTKPKGPRKPYVRTIKNPHEYDLPAGDEWLCLLAACELLGVGASQLQLLALTDGIERVKGAPIKGGMAATFFHVGDLRNVKRRRQEKARWSTLGTGIVDAELDELDFPLAA